MIAGTVAIFLAIFISLRIMNGVSHEVIRSAMPSEALIKKPKPAGSASSEKAAPTKEKSVPTEEKTIRFEGLHVNPTMEK